MVNRRSRGGAGSQIVPGGYFGAGFSVGRRVAGTVVVKRDEL
jgi:hypothetical protein